MTYDCILVIEGEGKMGVLDMRTILIVALAAVAIGVWTVPVTAAQGSSCICGEKTGCTFKGCVAGKCSYLCKQVKSIKMSPK